LKIDLGLEDYAAGTRSDERRELALRLGGHIASMGSALMAV